MKENSIQQANDLFERFGEGILRDETCRHLLAAYRKSIEETWETMKTIGVVTTCIACSGKNTAGCCFYGVEEWYDETLLFINRLLGVKIPESREIDKRCLFVGQTGCKLLARYFFCINYLCDELKAMMNPLDRKHLMAVSGKEISSGIQVEQAIRKWIAANLKGEPHECFSSNL